MHDGGAELHGCGADHARRNGVDRSGGCKLGFSAVNGRVGRSVDDRIGGVVADRGLDVGGPGKVATGAVERDQVDLGRELAQQRMAKLAACAQEQHLHAGAPAA